MFRFFYLLRQTMLLFKESKKIIFITIVFLTIGIVTLGSTYIIGTKLFQSSLSATNKLNITAFFSLDTTPQEIANTTEEIKSIDGVKSVSLITNEQAKQDFLNVFPQYKDIMNSLKRNPLPYTIKVEINDLSSGERIKDLIKDFPNIDSVVFSADTAKKLNNLVKLLWTLFVSILIVVIAEFIFIVQSSTSFLIDFRKTEIRVLNLIGADKGFIEFPFLILFSMFSIIAWAISILILQKINIWSDSIVQSLLPFSNVYFSVNTFNVFLSLLAFSLVLSIIGSLIPLRRVS
ncbi:MAG: permease-like cell division protein FtsX [Caldiserica bacterium]|nr:permease-like cell division protein FtsX [Caldisericota bacterium]